MYKWVLVVGIVALAGCVPAAVQRQMNADAIAFNRWVEKAEAYAAELAEVRADLAAAQAMLKSDATTPEKIAALTATIAKNTERFLELQALGQEAWDRALASKASYNKLYAENDIPWWQSLGGILIAVASSGIVGRYVGQSSGNEKAQLAVKGVEALVRGVSASFATLNSADADVVRTNIASVEDAMGVRSENREIRTSIGL